MLPINFRTTLMKTQSLEQRIIKELSKGLSKEEKDVTKVSRFGYRFDGEHYRKTASSRPYLRSRENNNNN